MKILITGSRGLLGSALKFLDIEHEVVKPQRREDFGIYSLPLTRAWPSYYELTDELPKDLGKFHLAFLCAGTKGTQECEGNRKVFQADVDGNIRLARALLKQDTFVVFVSTDAVETSLNTAYARNRFMVELAIGGLRNVAIFRPGRFTEQNVAEAATRLAEIGIKRKEGLHRWP